MLKEKITRQLALAIVLLATVLISVSAYFIYSTKDDIKQQNKQYLSEIAVQNAEVIKNTVRMELDKIEAIANIIGSREKFDVDYALAVLKAESKRHSFKRLAYVPSDGNAVTTDDVSFNVLGRSYYKKALAGESNVSDRLTDKIGGNFINVYAVPLYHKGHIYGVIIATKDTNVLSELLKHNSFDGEGFSYIITKDGSPVVNTVHKNSLSSFDNLFDSMRKNHVDENLIAELKRNMALNKGGIFENDMSDVPKVLAYSSVGINDWFVISVVPKQVIAQNADRLINRNVTSAVITVIVMGALIFFIVVQNYKNRRKLEQLAYVDSITGGNNFNKFKLLAAEMIARNKGKNLYMIRIDIDNFKLLNDMYGFREGDEILVGINQLLSRMDSGRDLHARLSDDNFIWLVNCLTEEEAVSKIRQFNDAFQGTMSQDQKGYKLGFTFGAYKIHPKNMDVDKIIDRAAMAHQSAKLLHADPKVVFYDEKIRNDAIRIKTIENMMYDALANREFVVYLQPKYNVSTSTIEGAEALVRWVRDGKVIPPSEFISIFERNGFIVNMDMYVLEEVCRLQRKWLDMGLNPVPISINQSKSLVYSKDYVDKLYGVITRYDLPARLIEVELLETIIHDNVTELISIIRQLRRIGLLICIDDFGSGYSSLNMLKDFDVDVLKIDREFLNNAEISERAKYVLAQIITLAKGLKMIVVTEGVETEKQAGLLKELECDTAQGFFYARPMPCEQFEKLLSVPGRTRTFESSREDQLNHELT